MFFITSHNTFLANGENRRDNLISHILYLFVVVKFKYPLWSLKRVSSPLVETKSNSVASDGQRESKS